MVGLAPCVFYRFEACRKVAPGAEGVVVLAGAYYGLGDSTILSIRSASISVLGMNGDMALGEFKEKRSFGVLYQ